MGINFLRNLILADYIMQNLELYFENFHNFVINYYFQFKRNKIVFCSVFLLKVAIKWKRKREIFSVLANSC